MSDERTDKLMTTEQTQKAAREIIIKLKKGFFDSLMEETKDWSDKGRWMVAARSSNLIWAEIYNPTMQTVLKELSKQDVVPS